MTETESAGTPVNSSLSAEAAEFVPSGVPLPNGLKNGSKSGSVQSGVPTSISGWKDKQRTGTELPGFVTSCYPFVQPNGSVRPPINRFPSPYQIPGNLRFQRMPMSIPLPNSTWTQPSPLAPPAKVMVNHFLHPRTPLGESYSPSDTVRPTRFPANGLLPDPHSVPMVRQAAPALLVKPHTSADMLYPLIRGSAETPLPFFHPNQMSKPPPTTTQMSTPTPLLPLPKAARPPRCPPPAQHPQMMNPGMTPFVRMAVPASSSAVMSKPMAAHASSSAIMSGSKAGPFEVKSSSPLPSSNFPPQKKPLPNSTVNSVAPLAKEKIQTEAVFFEPKRHNLGQSANNLLEQITVATPKSKLGQAERRRRKMSSINIPRGQSTKSCHAPQSIKEPVRPTSPVFVSRSAQADFPPNFRFLCLQDLPHGLFKDENDSNDNGKGFESEEGTEKGLSLADKNQNISMERLSIGIQVSQSGIKLTSEERSCSPTHTFNVKSISFWKEKNRHLAGVSEMEKLDPSSSPSRIPSSQPSPTLIKNSNAPRCINSETRTKIVAKDKKRSEVNQDSDHFKKSSGRKHHKDGTRSPGRIGASRFLSRSSSSISSSGARDDDEKIDLHSWTDFPSLGSCVSMPRVTPAASTSDEATSIKIQRSQDAPPWMLRESSRDFEEDGKENVSNQHRNKAEPSIHVENARAMVEKTPKTMRKTGPAQEKSSGNSGNSQHSTAQPTVPLPNHQLQGLLSNLQQSQPQPSHIFHSQSTKNQPGSSMAPVKNYALAAQGRTVRTPNPVSANYPSPQAPGNSSSLSPHSNSQKPSDEHLQQQQKQQLSRSRHNSQPKIGTPLNQECLASNVSRLRPHTPTRPSSDTPSTGQSASNLTCSADSTSRHKNTSAMNGSSNFLSEELKNRSKTPERDRENNVDRSKYKREESKSQAEEADDGQEYDDSNQSRRRRRRNRTRSKKVKSLQDMNKSDMEGISGDDAKDGAVSSSKASEMTLHFQDVEEFPDLVSSSRGLSQEAFPYVATERSTLSGTSLSFSDVIKLQNHSRPHSLTGSGVSGDNDEDGSCNMAESKRARKRRKRREQANQAAETELAEISLEQRLLKEGLKKSVATTPGLISDSSIVKEAKKPGGSSGKKSKEPITFDIAAMLDAMQKKSADPHPTSSAAPTSPASSRKGQQKVVKAPGGQASINMLDSSGPVQKRGKEREVAKPKKPSPLKKVILKEREEKKRMRLLDGKDDMMGSSTGVGMLGTESELSQDALSSKSEGTEGGEQLERAELSADLSPISQTSPIPMSPASPGNSGVNSPVAGSGRDPVVMKIHSRRFREYCTQILDKEIDQCCTVLLQDLVRFQDRMYHKDPVKAKNKRRLVLGLREVTKHLRLKKIKCVVISPNLEKIQSKGGLDEALNKILNMCQDQDVPFVFALGRRALGRACAKLVPVSVVGIFNFDGCEDKYHTLIALTANARTAYNDMVLAVEEEVAQHTSSMSWQAPSISSVTSLLPSHMGHSRTPSGCSAISFTSSINSEPQSEFYPGYADEQRLSEVTNGTKGMNLTNDIDDGNEADIEDFGEAKKKRRVLRGGNSVRFGEGSSLDEKVAGETGGGSGLSNSNSNGVVSTGGSNNNNNNGSNNATGTSGAGAIDVRPHLHHHNLHHHRRQSSISSLARINEGVDDEVSTKPCASAEVDGENKATEKIENTVPEVSHIDSIHSPHYKLDSEILPDSVVRKGSWDYEEPDNEDVDENANEEEDEEKEEEEEEEEEEEKETKGQGPRRGHLRQRSMDKKERIKNWLESQSNIPLGD